MKTRHWRYWLLLAIAVGTVATGVIQMVAPGFVLGILSAEATQTSRHFFAIVGMFMGVIGGALAHALWSAKHHPVVVFWAGVQKIGAAVAVTVGVTHGLFSALALLVAGFDLFSGAIAFWYWWEIRNLT